MRLAWASHGMVWDLCYGVTGYGVWEKTGQPLSIFQQGSSATPVAQPAEGLKDSVLGSDHSSPG